VANQSLKAAIPAPIRDAVAVVLDVLHIRKRFVDGPMDLIHQKDLMWM
jgi:hypothetical protein